MAEKKASLKPASEAAPAKKPAAKKAPAKKPAAKKAPAKKPVAKKPLGKPAVRRNTCFTIMPFGGWFDDYYESIFKPAIEAAGLTPKRADDLYTPSAIVNDIWILTKTAKIILADLTGKNANVFYELGLAHALAKPVVLVAESMDDIPFDLRALRIIEYNKNEPRWGENLRSKITRSLTEVLDSKLVSVLPVFLETKDRSEPKPISEQERINLEILQELNQLKRQIGRPHWSEPSLPDLTRDPKSQASQYVRWAIREGLSDREISNEVEANYSPPPGWAEAALAEWRSRLKIHDPE